MKNKMHVLLTLMTLFPLTVGAWENNSKNQDYQYFEQGKIPKAVVTTYETAFGGGSKGKLFYAVIALLPYSMLVLFQNNIFIANSLLALFLFLYASYIPDVGWPIFLILISFGVMSTLWRIWTPYYSD